MKHIISLFAIGVIMVIQGCSQELLNRTAYETLQNIHKQQCEETLSDECMKQKSYHEYQRSRKLIAHPSSRKKI